MSITDDIYHCAMCGIHLFDTSPDALARHAAHSKKFQAEVQAKIDRAIARQQREDDTAT